MAEVIAPYALTTRQRVKDRLAITVTSFDTFIDRLVSSVTDFIEGECGGRRFQETAYVNEVYSIYGSDQKFLLLKQSPVSSVTSLQYRAGLKSNPNWTNFNADDWELLEDGKSGIVRIYNLAFKGVNAIRASYTAGYKIDFANAGGATHTLPFDLTDLCERLAVKLFKRREAEGRQQEAFEGGSVTWKDLLSPEDQAVIARHRRPPQFV